MKKWFWFYIPFAIEINCAFAQEESATTDPVWEFNASASFFFIPDDFFVLPIFMADKNKLHLEARYNYEDKETFSAWVGYNFVGVNDFEYEITPMIGGVVGLSNGMAPGLKFTFSFKGFELYSEAEQYFDLETSENHFFYAWSELTYSPNDWLWFGLSGQRTRVYQTDLDIQRGLLIGAEYKNWGLTAYFYNIASDDPFLMISLSKGF